MSPTHNFELLTTQHIPELNSEARLYRHAPTGAELLSVINDDSNKSFGITFRTPPADSTGIAHILEHSVLCGSRKYPSKEPFVELLKGSLNTFLNAMTYPDMTTYPVASQNLQDFYNLVDVYLDAVLYPRLTPQVLQQEGWHYELATADVPLSYKGVVFNEMKGANSSPDRLLDHYAQEAILPDTIYRHDSGGDPAVIPDLTWEQFESFHKSYYHPSNSRIFFYGDDDPTERLRRIDEFLAEFRQQEVNSAIGLQPRFDQPRTVERTYPVAEDEIGERKTMVSVGWLLPEKNDAELMLALQVLEYLLLGTAGAPLRKALIESGLGEDLANAGLNPYYRQMVFSVGLKGTKTDTTEAVESLIVETLRGLAEAEMEPAAIEAAVNAIEFQLRENNTGSFPRGLSLMIRALTVWLHDGDPMVGLAFEEALGSIKARLAAGEPLFQNLIREHLLDNPHRVTLTLRPDPTLAAQIEADEQARLTAVQAELTDAEIERIIAETDSLKAAQERADSAEALASIPRLTRADLDKNIKTIPSEVSYVEGSQLLYHDIFTNGILYLDLALNLHTLPQSLLPYVPLYGRALLEMGTATEDFVKLSQRIDRETGGIYTKIFTSAVRGQREGAVWLEVRGKAMIGQASALMEILHDVLMTVNLDNADRFLQIVLEEKAGMEAQLMPAGHRMVNRRLRAHFNEADWAAEQMTGVSYLLFLRDLAERLQGDWAGVRGDLEKLHQTLVNRNTLIGNITVDESSWSRVHEPLTAFLQAMPASDATIVEWEPVALAQQEGLTIPARVNYVGRVADVAALGVKLTGGLQVASRALSLSYMWEKVRVQGGAYGGFASLDALHGTFSFLSYRDPNLVQTLNVYAGAADSLRGVELSEDELTKAIIGTISDLDQYQLPDAQGNTALERYLAGITDEYRQQRRDEVLSATIADFHALADALDLVTEQGHIVVLGLQQVLEQASDEIEGGVDDYESHVTSPPPAPSPFGEGA